MKRDVVDAVIPHETDVARTDIFSGRSENGPPFGVRPKRARRSPDLNVVRAVRATAAETTIDEQIIVASLLDKIWRLIIGLVSANYPDSDGVGLWLECEGIYLDHGDPAGE